MTPISHLEDSAPDPHETFLRLWMQHGPELRAFVRSCCPNAQEVDDVMQEVGVAALRKFSTLDDHAALGPWACLIVRYELLSALAAAVPNERQVGKFTPLAPKTKQKPQKRDRSRKQQKTF